MVFLLSGRDYQRTNTVITIVMLWNTLMSMDQNIRALRTRIPSKITAV